MTNRFIPYIILLGFVFFLNSCAVKADKIYKESDIKIIPKVEKLQLNSGAFKFNEDTKFVVSNEAEKVVANILIEKFKTVANWDLQFTTKSPKNNYLEFKFNKALKAESYLLNVSKTAINIEASDNSGFLYAVQSLRQLLPPAIESKEKVTQVIWEIPSVQIEDGPRFKWRGLMLDLSRHFFDKNYVLETIDAIALLKMNVLHLHLVDDHGWRIEIKKYPKLTEVGAWRVDQEDVPWASRTKNNPDEKGTYGGFLTQEELKEIVAHAQSRGVDVVPEIEMPAHVSSAIAAYPELSCFEKPIGIPSGALWPITDIYCAGKEHTFHFLEDVLSEVMDIFPSKYIHIGGDEATKTNWETCKHCAKRIKDEGLHDVEELQSYFVKRIEKFINSKGKKLIGWDEILEGGLAPDATVMSWRGFKGGLEAAAQGHDVIMTPTGFCYFDYYQGTPKYEPVAAGPVTTLSKVYQFDPVVDTMTEAEANHVLGGQANVWAEHIPTESHSQYMIFPRLTALAETVWSTKKSRNWNDFSNRIPSMFKRFEYLGVNYAKSAYLVTSKVKSNPENKTVSLVLYNEFPESDIRYTLNGEDLNTNAVPFLSPIVIDKTTTVNASLFKNDKPVGIIFKDTIKFHNAVSSRVHYASNYHDRYQGSGAFNLVNTLRGSKNFRDGRWQAWLNKNAEITIDLETEKTINLVTIGSMENQGNAIFYPTKIEVWTSTNGKDFTIQNTINRAYLPNTESELKSFVIDLESHNARFVKVKISLNEKVRERGEGWIFVDEILID
ncbi:MAG: family 20 glycosylhydrolase [Algibacter sp.]|uniref:glycoside hydrolase family 20 protein n=1 Tax=Algibacter sp. TaxID=1872428 RepID=UPI00329A34EC